MDIWDALDHPVLFTVGFFTLAVVISLGWAMLRIAIVRARGGSASGVDVAAVEAAWRQRTKASDVVDVTQLQSMIQEAFVSDASTDVAGQSKEARIAHLEALHADGRITAEKLSQLKAAIASEA
ncbi:hypothetical protein [Aeromicrobium sp. NPDC092404]|uniref:hypothetical protein n=1 Tax=Aeromicrobium sp. NPDC092404 TaxID=3154976 RepID=UPI00343644CB